MSVVQVAGALLISRRKMGSMESVRQLSRLWQYKLTDRGVYLCIRCSGIHRSMGTHISKGM